MIWIVLIKIACSGDSCTIQSADASVVNEARSEALSKACDASADCVEPRPGFYVIRVRPTPPAPGRKAVSL